MNTIAILQSNISRTEQDLAELNDLAASGKYTDYIINRAYSTLRIELEQKLTSDRLDLLDLLTAEFSNANTEFFNTPYDSPAMPEIRQRMFDLGEQQRSLELALDGRTRKFTLTSLINDQPSSSIQPRLRLSTDSDDEFNLELHEFQEDGYLAFGLAPSATPEAIMAAAAFNGTFHDIPWDEVQSLPNRSDRVALTQKYYLEAAKSNLAKLNTLLETQAYELAIYVDGDPTEAELAELNRRAAL